MRYKIPKDLTLILSTNARIPWENSWTTIAMINPTRMYPRYSSGRIGFIPGRTNATSGPGSAFRCAGVNPNTSQAVMIINAVMSTMVIKQKIRLKFP